MVEPTREAWLSRMAVTGLTISGDPAPEDVPSVGEAMRSVANWEVRPVVEIPLSHPNALQEVDRKWYVHAVRSGLLGDDRPFLLSSPGSGSSTFGWAVVKWAPGAEPAQRLARDEEGLDLLAMSLDGTVVCAVTEEEYDYWIVVQQLR
ncbi:hypothetical protein [Streptomyces sp. Qhu_M48]|uniref:hypothetical protein n=1 Tax=Streptomyces sp. Qhu_M48 TaxID=3435889 RepID=UPI003F4FC4DF